ncbi:restriction endonuclease [Roseicyclus marinus]|uniref:restriction endonuclease n=1 Tax=Roseicyclus marinus TaxID=2161673 RepID=UPI00240FDB69|nr:restriction endonuclease [Roseicyclus marinus]MDG3041217.1 restriction endonuclease [Roseicyclus marinus]
MSSMKGAIVNAVFRLPPTEGEIAIDALCLRALKKLNGRVTLSDEEYISRFKKTLYSALKESDLQHSDQGGMPTFEYTDNTLLKLRWNILSHTDRRQRAKMERRAAAIDWIDGLKDDRHYEYLGGLLMRKLGASRIHVTPKGNEFGIDFLAIAPAFSRSGMFLSKGRGVRIVGQSKYYSQPVTRDKVQAFNDVMNSIRNNKEELINVLPSWFRNSPAPLIGCFVAHSGYQSGARKSAEQNGYLLLDTRAAGEIVSCVGKMDHLRNEADVIRHLWEEIAALQRSSAAA